MPNFDIAIDQNGNFSKSFIALLQANYLFALEAIDKKGVSGGILAFSANLLTNNKMSIENIFMPPTVAIENKSITKGKDEKIFGYAYPNSAVELRIDSILKQSTKADGTGYYEIVVNTQRFSPKIHYIEARQIDSQGIASGFSSPKNFAVSALSVPQADFNSDGIIDIKDWSIFLFRWKANPILRAFDDLNMDGKIDISDLSIFLKAMKGL